jgi:hypothetical protein
MEEQVAIALEKRHVELVKIIQSFENLEKSEEWATLRKYVFDGALSSLEKQLIMEAERATLDFPKIYRLQGELSWARKFCDINKFIGTQTKLLEEINKKLK